MQVDQVAAIVTFVKDCVTLFRGDKLLRQALQRLQESFPDGSRPLLLITDVCTRWNYTFLMLERFYELADFVKQALQQCALNVDKVFRVEHAEKAVALLRQLDVVLLDIPALVTVLRPCKDASDMMESDRGQLSQLLFVQDCVEVQLSVSASIMPSASESLHVMLMCCAGC